MLAMMEVPQDHGTVGRDERSADRVVGAPQLHVGRVGGIAHVQRVEQQDASQVSHLQFAPDACQPVAPRGVHVGRPKAAGRPFGLGETPIADHVLVEAGRLIGGVLGQLGGRGRVAGMVGRLERPDLAAST